MCRYFYAFKVTSKNMLKKRTVIEWMVILSIIGIIYLGGWQAEVIGTLQRGLLFTGVMNPDVEKNEGISPANYQFSVVSSEGELIDFSDLKNKVVFLNFWATWCPPCVAEMPGIQQLYESVDREDIVFVMVSADQEPEKAVDFIKRKGYTFPVYFVDGAVPPAYQTTSIPTTFVISPKGKIVYKKEGLANYNTEAFQQFLQAQKEP